MKTLCRVYDSYGQARAAVDAVEKAGVPASNVSIVANKDVSAEHADVDEVSDAAKGAGIGGALGGGAGLLAGLGLLAIPGLGPVVAAGWLGSTAVGGAPGAATRGRCSGGLAGVACRRRRRWGRDWRHCRRLGRRRSGSRACRRLLRVGSPRGY